VRLASERAHLQVVPAAPHTLALGEERLVKQDQTISWGGVRYCKPHPAGAASSCGAAPGVRSW
jgi:hypothetical protein